MKANYRNWVPKHLLYLSGFLAVLCYVITMILQWALHDGTTKAILSSFLLIAAILLTTTFLWMARMYRAFSMMASASYPKKTLLEKSPTMLKFPEMNWRWM